MGVKARATFFFAALSVSACTSPVEPAGEIILAPAIVAPRALVDRAQRLTLEVHNVRSAGLCNPETGEVPMLSDVGKILEEELRIGGCGDPAVFCGSVQIPSGAALRLFKLFATDAAGVVYARGCAEAVLDKARENVTLRLVANGQ